MDDLLSSAVEGEWPVLAAWGAAPWAEKRANWVRRVARDYGIQMQCLGRTAAGAPRHPLYVKSDQPFESWP